MHIEKKNGSKEVALLNILEEINENFVKLNEKMDIIIEIRKQDRKPNRFNGVFSASLAGFQATGLRFQAHRK